MLGDIVDEQAATLLAANERVGEAPDVRSDLDARVAGIVRLGVARFALGVCRNLASHTRRAGTRTKRFERAALPLAAEILPPAYSEVDATRLALCLGMLDRRDQRVVLMTFQEDRDAAEIASALALTVSHVRVIRHRTLTALRRCVAGERP